MSTHIANVSWGKDSLAMLLVLIERRMPIDEVVFYDTGMEFEAIYRERDRILPVLAERGIRYTELRPKRPFLYDMLVKPVTHRDGTTTRGYGWCGGTCRWGTKSKTLAIDRYVRDRGGVSLIGIAADETERAHRDGSVGKIMPLIEWGMTEKDFLELCYSRGCTWEQDGIKLYDVLDRVSCWCCRNKNLKEIDGMRNSLPEYYQRLKSLETAIGVPMKGDRWLEVDAHGHQQG